VELTGAIAQLEARAHASGLALQVTPLLEFARRYAAVEAPASSPAQRLAAVLSASDPRRADFTRWYAFLERLVGDLDAPPQNPVMAEIHARNLDVLLFMLETALRDRTKAVDAEAADAILEGRLTLAAALGQAGGQP